MTINGRFSTRQTDESKVQRALLTLFLLIGTVVIASYGVKSGNLIILALLLLFPVAVYFLKDPPKWFVFAVLAQMAWARIPGFNMPSLTPFSLAVIALLGSGFALKALKKIETPQYAGTEFWLLSFAIIVIATALVRGTGFAIFGGESWGGGKYITMAMLFFLYFSVRKFQFRKGHVLWLIWGGIFATGMLALGQFLFSYTGGRTYFINQFMEIQAASAAGSELLSNDAAVVRYSHFRWLAYAILPLSLFWPQRKILSLLFAVIAAVLMLLTGFRSEVASIGMVYFLCGLVLTKRKKEFLFFIAAAGMVGYGLLLLFADILPDAMIRSVSFLPGVEASGAVAESARKSTEWRFLVWEYCLREAPRYFLIGRGLAFDVAQWAWLQVSVYSSPEFFYGTHSYHNGPLALLLDFGVFGLITMTGFFISSSMDAIRRLRSIKAKNTIYYKFAVYMTVLHIWMVVKFYLIYGDLNYYLSRMMIIYTTLLAVLSFMQQSSAETQTSSGMPRNSQNNNGRVRRTNSPKVI